MKDNEIPNNTEKSSKTHQNGKFLRCINIDCVFNSSNEQGAVRNTCRHPNVVVESRYADITIAICSEFRSKKDYTFEKPATLIESKTGEKTEIIGTPDLGIETIEKVTTKELEDEVSKGNESGKTTSEKVKAAEQERINVQNHLKPVIIESAPLAPEELTPDEIYNLSTKRGTDF